MWKSLSEWLRRVSTGWVALIALVIFLSFSALVLPSQSANAEIDSQGVGSPDLSFYYSPDELYSMAEAYGEAGRDAYVRARFTFDVVWPIVYTLFLSTALSWLYTRVFSAGSFWQRANLAPVLGALFDFLENGSTSLVMLRYPARTPVIDVLAPVFTMVKWALVTGSFVLLLVGVFAGVWRWIRVRREA
ncbi:MAG: hypothetical protein PVG32_21235 [Anaerolineales bacterium]|jgi:hypothetical protein